MYFSLSFIILSLLLFFTTLFAFNTTKKFRVHIIACQKDSQCLSSTHFCNTKQYFCILKHSLNSTCQNDYKFSKLATVTINYIVNHVKKIEIIQYQIITKSKYCSSCIGDAQYANHHCHLFNCTTLLKTLQKHS